MGAHKLSRSARGRKREPGPTPEQAAFSSWSDDLSAAGDDPDLARGLAAMGRQRGWVTKHGSIVPPGTKPPTADDEMNRAIRKAAAR